MDKLETIVDTMFQDLWNNGITPEELEVVLVSILTRVFLNCVTDKSPKGIKHMMSRYTDGVIKVMALERLVCERFV